MMRLTSVVVLFLFMFSLVATPVSAATTDGFSKGVTARELREQYEDDTIRILLVVGHEPMYGGAVYKGVYEREIVYDIAVELERLLGANKKYEVILSRDGQAWEQRIARHFDKEERSIKKFLAAQKKKMQKVVKNEDDDEDAGEEAGGHKIHHATAPEDVALRLYGMNHWANKNKVDVMVHLHVNDAPDHGPNTPSKYTGFAVYVPDAVFGNSKTSTELGEYIANRLLALGDYSTLPGEGGGVVPTRELIAIGANGTLNIPSVLIEYGYISEPRFSLSEYRQTVTKDAAYQTYLALQDFFDDEVESPRAVAKLPATWPKPVISCAPFTSALLPAKSEGDIDTTGAVERLQAILAKDSAVYPEGLVTGYFGPATKRAVEALQKKHGIVSSGTPETTGYGAVGPRTAKALLTLCSTY